MSYSVTEAVDRYVAELEVPREPDGKWHPSSIYGCPRQSIYSIRGIPETNPKDARSRRILRMGTVFHEFVQAALVNLVPDEVKAVYVEVPIEHPELGISGTADVLVEQEGAYELLELKSIGSQAFKYRDLPKPDHVGQWTAYATALRDYGSPVLGLQALGDGLVKGRICYFSKDDLLIEECDVLWSEAKEVELRARIANLEAHRTGPLPPRLETTVVKGQEKRSWQCNYCPWMMRCWDLDGDTEIASLDEAA